MLAECYRQHYIVITLSCIDKLSAFIFTYMKKHLLLVLLLVTGLWANAQLPVNGIDVQHYSFSVSVSDSNNTITCSALINMHFTKDVNKVQLNLANKKADGKGMIVSAVNSNGKAVNFQQDSDHLYIEEAHRKADTVMYAIDYAGVPKDGLIISENNYGDRTFFGDNWPNRAHNWLPCNDHLSDKATVDFIVTAPDHYSVVSNGLMTGEEQLPDHFKQTTYSEAKPIATKIMVIGLADFAIDSVGVADGKNIYSYVFKEDVGNGFKHYRYAPEIVNWYAQRIAQFPFEKLADVQSKTIFGGMENAGCIFYFENSVNSPGVEALMAHEIAHQWFGDDATEKDWPHLWLSEGFATYMTHLYHESKYGEDSFNNRMMEDRQKVIAFSHQRNTPVVDTTASGDLMQLLNANSYQKGGWVLHMLRRQFGDSLFWKSVKTYYTTYAGSNADTRDVKAVFEKTVNQNLDTFFKQWLYTGGQPDLDITWTYNPLHKTVQLDIQQLQNDLFVFPLEFSFRDNTNTADQKITIQKKHTSIEIPVSFKPADVVIDPKCNLLAEWTVQSR